DPFTQDDFYKFFAFFNNVPESGRAIKLGNSPPMIKTPTRAQREQESALQAHLADLEGQAQRREPEIASAQLAWESSSRDRRPFDWVSPEHLVARYSVEGTLGPDGTA